MRESMCLYQLPLTLFVQAPYREENRLGTLSYSLPRGEISRHGQPPSVVSSAFNLTSPSSSSPFLSSSHLLLTFHFFLFHLLLFSLQIIPPFTCHCRVHKWSRAHPRYRCASAVIPAHHQSGRLPHIQTTTELIASILFLSSTTTSFFWAC
ncbi:hypothetical protein HDV57DRAFT_498871 [Trichoderma longibrachiatum]